MKDVLKKSGALFLFTVFAGFIMTVFEVAVAYGIGQMIDTVSGSALGSLNKVGVFCIAVIALYMLFGALYTHFSKKLNFSYLTTMKEMIFSKIFSSPISEYQEHNKAYYLNLLTQDIDRVNENYLTLRYDNIVYFGEIIISLIALLSISWEMSLIFIAITTVTTVIPQLFASIQSAKTEQYSATLEKYVEFMDIFLSGYEFMRSLAIERSVFNRINEWGKIHILRGASENCHCQDTS